MNTVNFAGQDLTPTKIVCIGRNYSAHIEELGNALPEQMVIFLKPNSAISSEVIASGSEAVHYEGEICFLCMHGAFSGVGFGLDLTKRKLQDKLREQGLPWERSKAFDGSALFSPFVEVQKSNDPYSIELEINKRTVQADTSASMIYQPPEILREIGSFMTLNDGDIVMTGTPAGVGKLNASDDIVGKISQSGKTLTSQHWKAK